MRSTLRGFGVLAGFLALAWAGYLVCFDGCHARELSTVAVEGDVRRTRGGREEGVVPGMLLRDGEHLRTGASGRAVLDAGSGARLQVEPNAELQVLDVGHEAVRVALEGGRLRATVRAEGPRLEVRAGERFVEARDAELEIAREGDLVGVVVDRGEARLLQGGEARSIAAGNRFLQVDGGDGSLDDAAEALLLTVASLPGTTRSAEVEIHGETLPASRVRAGFHGNWREGRADDRGQFTLTVPLAEGVNVLRLEAVDAFGRTRRDEVRVVRDTTAPRLGVEVRWR